MDSPFLRITASAHRGKCARCLQVPRDGGKGGIRKGGNGTVQLLSVAEASSDLKSSPDADKNASTVGVKNRKSQFLAFFFNHWEMFGERRLDDCSRSLSAFGETPVSLSPYQQQSPSLRGLFTAPYKYAFCAGASPRRAALLLWHHNKHLDGNASPPLPGKRVFSIDGGGNRTIAPPLSLLPHQHHRRARRGRCTERRGIPCMLLVEVPY